MRSSRFTSDQMPPRIWPAAGGTAGRRLLTQRTAGDQPADHDICHNQQDHEEQDGRQDIPVQRPKKFPQNRLPVWLQQVYRAQPLICNATG